MQFLHAPAYVLVTGLLAQQNINIQADDDGGEMDPHGADEVGFLSLLWECGRESKREGVDEG